ncbi:MAG TPA: hypothetical protein VGP94_13595 [Tepidisphaeraceae bacterium]|jgi:hypothetical protein|nr:hypothetical protein [Tepidisphaeraceae bacterium]
MNDTDNKIDILITRHLGKQLDRHVGRAQRAFLAEVSQRRRWYIPRYWAVAATLLITATLAGVFAVKNLFTAPTPDETPVGPISNSESKPLMPVAQTVAWRTMDDGTVMMNGDVPIRQLRRQVVEHVKWYDPQRKTTVELHQPQEQIMLIGYW